MKSGARMGGDADRGPRDHALKVKIDGESAIWFCHRCRERGHILRHNTPNPDGKRRSQKPPPERHKRLSDRGCELWNSACEIAGGCIAESYLNSHGCHIPPRSGHLRLHPALPYYVRGQGQPLHVGPALLGLVTDIESGEPISLHQTWITASGEANLGEHKPRKLLWNHRSDGVVRLWPDAETTMGLVLGKSIETCLVAARARLGPVWSTISACNLASFPVLPGLEGLTILVDHDKPDKYGRRAGLLAAIELRDRYALAGLDPERDIQVVCPNQEDSGVADFAVEDAP